MTKEILRLNEISPEAVKVLGKDYPLVKESKAPVGIMLRSFAMHEYDLPESVLAVARAGAGVNNIPVGEYTKKGVVVFNTPGANANAVKELVLCAMLLASRRISESIVWASSLKGKGDEVPKLVEKGKNSFVGPELAGKTLGVIGLGAIGAMVANAAVGLGMDVIGYDPFISVDAAWNMSRSVTRETDVNNIYKQCDYITLHVPLNDKTRAMIDAKAIAKMKDGTAIINMSRGELVNTADLLQGLKDGKLARYVTDFPNDALIGVENVVCIPHLGASTPEAEDNCAVMAAKQLVNYIEHGTIVNSVNFPACDLPRSGTARITVHHLNIQSMLVQMTNAISTAKINISNMVSQSRGDYAYTIFELDDKPTDALISNLNAIKDILKIRVI